MWYNEYHIVNVERNASFANLKKKCPERKLNKVLNQFKIAVRAGNVNKM